MLKAFQLIIGCLLTSNAATGIAMEILLNG